MEEASWGDFLVPCDGDTIAVLGVGAAIDVFASGEESAMAKGV